MAALSCICEAAHKSRSRVASMVLQKGLDMSKLFEDRDYYYGYDTPGYRRDEKFRASLVIGFLLILTPIVIGVLAFISSWNTMADVRTHVGTAYNKAIAAPTAGMMADRLDEVLGALQERGMDTGHTYGVHSAKSDQGLAYQNIQGYRDRLRLLESAPPDSTGLAMSLADIRVGLDKAGVGWTLGAYWDALSTKVFWAMIPVTVIVWILVYWVAIPTVDYWIDKWQNRKNDGAQPA